MNALIICCVSPVQASSLNKDECTQLHDMPIVNNSVTWNFHYITEQVKWYTCLMMK